MRFALSVLPFLAAFACSTPQQAAPVQQAAPDASLRVGADQFQNPDCMWEHIDTVRAIEDEYTDVWLQEESGFRAWYQDAQASGASPEELADIRAQADELKAVLFEEFYGVLAALEADLCGEPVDPCDDPNNPDCCPYVGDDGQCYDDYCAAYPDDPQCQVWCDFPDDPACFCEYDPTHPDCGEPVDPCDPATGDCCDPGDPNCGGEPVDPCDPATGDCCDPDDPNCVQ